MIQLYFFFFSVITTGRNQADSRTHTSVTQSRGCVPVGAKPVRSGQWHPFVSLEYPRHTFRCQLVHRDERWNPSFLSSQGRKVMKTLMEQSYWASCLGPKGGNVLNKPAASIPTSESGLGTEGREQKDETEDFRQYHDEGGCIWKISNFQLFCSSIWFILGSVTGVIFISFSAGKGSCVWSPHGD